MHVRPTCEVRILVSIVIPVYNAEEWISEAIKSVLEQTYEHLEIILVDDGSTDQSVCVAEQLLRRGRFPYQIISQPNRGVSAARNRGWRSARGPWVQFLDADDLLHPRKIQLQVAQSVACTAADVIYSDWQRLVWRAAAWKADDEIRAPMIGQNILADILRDKNFQQLGSQMFKASILEAVGGFDEAHDLIEDVELCIKIGIAKGVFVKAGSNGPMSWYRDRPRSLSKRDQRKFVEACIRNAKLVEEHVRWSQCTCARTIEAIIDVYYDGARYFAGHDWKLFEQIARDIETLEPAFLPRAPERLRLISRVTGYRRAEWLAALYRRSKSMGACLWSGKRSQGIESWRSDDSIQ
jgi:glycosyltransferase involved in cell wall biosynthesis